MLSIDAFRQRDSELVCPNPQDFIGLVEGRNNQQPYAISFEESPRSFRLRLLTILAEDVALVPREVGYYTALVTCNTPDIELPPHLAGKEIITTYIKIDPAHQKEGLSSHLLNELFKILEKLKAVHLVEMGTEGERLKRRLIEAGYKLIDTRQTELTGELAYKDYGSC